VIQVYFLSILLNALSGFVLLADGLDGSGSDGGGFFKVPSFRLILGAASIITGILKLLSVVPGNYPIAGDLLPSLCGIGAGLIFLFEFYRERSTLATESALSTFLAKYKKGFGVIFIAAAFLHFLFPTALFL
jgi:hypothetical protein